MLQTYKTHLVSKQQLTNDVYVFTFVLDEPKEIIFTAGQYLIMLVPDLSCSTGAVVQRRLYSIASSCQEKTRFDLMVKIIPDGVAGKYFSSMRINDEITFQGPAGLFTMRQTQRQIIYLVTGTCIAPIWSMLHGLTIPSNHYLYWGLPHYKDLYFMDKLKKYEKDNPNFHFKIYLSREQNLNMVPEKDKKYFQLGHVTDGIPLANLSSYDFYLCSKPEIVDSLKKLLEQKGAKKEQVFFEKF